jgi:hypothetical protein
MKEVKLIGSKEFCAKVGIDPRTLYRRLKSNKITCYRVPKSKICLYDPAEVEKKTH